MLSEHEIPMVPSRFLPYLTLTPKIVGTEDREVPLIKYVPYKYNEVSRISQSSTSERDKFKRYLEGVKCNFDPFDLSLSDFYFISLNRKMSSSPLDEFSVDYYCGGNNCRTKSTQVFKSEELSFEWLDVEALPLIISADDKVLEVGVVTIKGFLKAVEANRVDFNGIFASMINGMNYVEALRFLDNLDPSSELTYCIEEANEILGHSVESIKSNPCKKCGFESMITITDMEAVIKPFRGFEYNARDRISFGKIRDSKPTSN